MLCPNWGSTLGTTRDPSAIAAIHGVYLNRGDNVGLAVARPDVEGAATDTVTRSRAWLRDNATADYLAGTALCEPPDHHTTTTASPTTTTTAPHTYAITWPSIYMYACPVKVM